MLEIVMTAAQVTIAVAAIILVLQVRNLIGLLENLLARISTRPLSVQQSIPSEYLHRDSEHRGGFSVYVYRDGSWHLESDFSRPGFESIPPTIPGRYNGQVIKKESTKRELK